LDDVRIKQSGQRREVANRDPEPHRLLGERHQFRPASANGGRLAGTQALSSRTTSGLGEHRQVCLDVSSQLFRKLLPARPRATSEWWFGEALGRPALDRHQAGVPSPGYGATGHGAGRKRGGFSAVAHVSVEDRLIDVEGVNALHGAMPQKSRELRASRAIYELDSELLPFGSQRGSP